MMAAIVQMTPVNCPLLGVSFRVVHSEDVLLGIDVVYIGRMWTRRHRPDVDHRDRVMSHFKDQRSRTTGVLTVPTTGNTFIGILMAGVLTGATMEVSVLTIVRLFQLAMMSQSRHDKLRSKPNRFMVGMWTQQCNNMMRTINQ